METAVVFLRNRQTKQQFEEKRRQKAIEIFSWSEMESFGKLLENPCAHPSTKFEVKHKLRKRLSTSFASVNLSPFIISSQKSLIIRISFTMKVLSGNCQTGEGKARFPFPGSKILIDLRFHVTLAHSYKIDSFQTFFQGIEYISI
jgi:hypothetical protein